ncbi:hypothetical protein [Curtobacterium sp. MCBD17_008]|uniref:hypothetical protein n=1 Tax=Curtobacterium sp. MCBD17_008 TaxID=2175656 RepID=UPI0011B5B646|nr:hypothetical protein [Curtobacterium sp. MCBD17_008]
MTGPEENASAADEKIAPDSSPLVSREPEATSSDDVSGSTDDASAGDEPVYDLGSTSRPRRDFDLAPSQGVVDTALAFERQMNLALEGSRIAQRIEDQALNHAWTALPGLLKMQDELQRQVNSALDGSRITQRFADRVGNDTRTALSGFLRMQDQLQWDADRFDRLLSSRFTESARAVERMLDATGWSSVFAIGEQLDRTLQGIADLLPTRETIRKLTLPRNLRPVVYDQGAFQMWMREGIPLAYVLDSSIIDALGETSTPQERRTLLGRHRDRIVNDCDALLDEITATSVLPYVETARMAIAGYRDGHHRLAQTWAAANLEALVKEFDKAHWGAIRDENQAPPKLFRWFFFVGQLRVVMATVGDTAPREFNRHASVHHTTKRRQFSKLNTMVAIAHLTSAICNYDAAAKQATAPRR